MIQPPLPLQDHWNFSFDAGAARGSQQSDYEGSLKSLGSFDTVQGFWRHWNALYDKPLPEGSNLRMFKADITPSWEHPANAKGGRWVLVVPKEASKKIWTALILALIGDQFSFSEDVCGAVLSTRFSTDTINLWNRDATSQTEVERCTGELLERLLITNDATIVTEYKAHQQSLDSNKSFAKIASSSGRIKRRYSMNTLRTHSGTAAASPRGSPRLSSSVDASDDAPLQPSPLSSPRNAPPHVALTRTTSTPAVMSGPLIVSTSAPAAVASSAAQRRSSPQPILTSTLANGSERNNSPSALLSPSTPPKQRPLSLSLSDESRQRAKRDSRKGRLEKRASEETLSKSSPAGAVQAASASAAPASDTSSTLLASAVQSSSPVAASALSESKQQVTSKPAAKQRAVPVPVIAVSPPSSTPSSVDITVTVPLKPLKRSSPLLLCTYLVFIFSVLVGVALVVYRPAYAEALFRS